MTAQEATVSEARPGTAADVMVKVEGLYKHFGTKKVVTEVLRGIDLEVKSGEFVAVVGPSGSGKSTLLSLIGTLDRPSKGTIIIDGQDISQLRGARLADFRFHNIGFVFQQYYLIPTLTALENIMVPLMPRRVRFNKRKRAAELLEQVELSHRAHHLPSELSGGEQQRVCLARALVAEPKLVLADEPTGNLDSRMGREVFNLLTSLNVDRGLTLILVTHNLELAERADRITSLRDGAIVDD